MDYNKKAAVDLHIHSNASDGTFSPKEILNQAKSLGLKAISITDHDTLEGAGQALPHACGDAIKFITGVEISTGLPSVFGYKGSCHILGYGIGLDDPCLNDMLTDLQNARLNRNPRIVEKLNALNIPITLDDITGAVPDKQTGRPHIAKVLVEKGFAGSISEAFDRYLGIGQPAYVDKYRVECSKAIEIINNAGGAAVLAHPCLLHPNSGTVFEDMLRFLISSGLAGIEVYYSEHSVEITSYYESIAKTYNLLTTGGSDFHGSIRPDIQMGVGSGDLHIPYHIFDQLESFIQNRQ